MHGRACAHVLRVMNRLCCSAARKLRVHPFSTEPCVLVRTDSHRLGCSTDGGPGRHRHPCPVKTHRWLRPAYQRACRVGSWGRARPCFPPRSQPPVLPSPPRPPPPHVNSLRHPRRSAAALGVRGRNAHARRAAPALRQWVRAAEPCAVACPLMRQKALAPALAWGQEGRTGISIVCLFVRGGTRASVVLGRRALHVWRSGWGAHPGGLSRNGTASCWAPRRRHDQACLAAWFRARLASAGRRDGGLMMHMADGGGAPRRTDTG